jgi:DNA-binding winged helix-turn-helix (wHTH) protein
MATADLTPLQFKGFTLDPAARTLVDANGRDVALRRSEFELLRAFVAAPGRALSRDHLLDAVASRHSEPFDRSVDVLVGRLRRKIEPEPGAPRLIVTVPGVGYRFATKPGSVSAESEAPPVAVSPASLAAPERRQLTILRCGLCGPALSAARRDPEDLQRLLVVFHERAEPVIIQAGGTVEDLARQLARARGRLALFQASDWLGPTISMLLWCADNLAGTARFVISPYGDITIVWLISFSAVLGARETARRCHAARPIPRRPRAVGHAPSPLGLGRAHSASARIFRPGAGRGWLGRSWSPLVAGDWPAPPPQREGRARWDQLGPRGADQTRGLSALPTHRS